MSTSSRTIYPADAPATTTPMATPPPPPNPPPIPVNGLRSSSTSVKALVNQFNKNQADQSPPDINNMSLNDGSTTPEINAIPPLRRARADSDVSTDDGNQELYTTPTNSSRNNSSSNSRKRPRSSELFNISMLKTISETLLMTAKRDCRDINLDSYSDDQLEQLKRLLSKPVENTMAPLHNQLKYAKNMDRSDLEYEEREIYRTVHASTLHELHVLKDKYEKERKDYQSFVDTTNDYLFNINMNVTRLEAEASARANEKLNAYIKAEIVRRYT
jgi:hypothetical protein